VGGGGAHSRRPLFRSELTTQQLSLRRRCDADRLVGDGPRSYMSSQPVKQASADRPALRDARFFLAIIANAPNCIVRQPVGGRVCRPTDGSIACPALRDRLRQRALRSARTNLIAPSRGQKDPDLKGRSPRGLRNFIFVHLGYTKQSL
jgi:hypothetical protein